MNRMKSILINSLIGLLIVGGIALIFIGPIQNYLVGSYQPTIDRQSVIKATKHNRPANYDFGSVKSVSPLQVANARWHANDNQYIGQIVAPSIGLHLPIGNGVDNNLLMLAAGTMKPNQVMGKGNYALAGHHMKDDSVLFSPVYEKGKVGTKYYLTDMNKVYEYTEISRQIIAPTDTNVINNTKHAVLTLITCNDSGSARLLTRAKLTDVMNMASAPKSVVHELGQTTNNHNVLKGY